MAQTPSLPKPLRYKVVSQLIHGFIEHCSGTDQKGHSGQLSHMKTQRCYMTTCLCFLSAFCLLTRLLGKVVITTSILFEKSFSYFSQQFNFALNVKPYTEGLFSDKNRYIEYCSAADQDF